MSTPPAASTWQQEFAEQPFRKKLTWLPNVAAAALAMPFRRFTDLPGHARARGR